MKIKYVIFKVGNKVKLLHSESEKIYIIKELEFSVLAHTLVAKIGKKHGWLCVTGMKKI